MPKYNTMVDVAFSVDHDFDDVESLTTTSEGIQLLITGLSKRLAYLNDNPSEAGEAFGICDTYEND